jgi:hypothetical protein
MKMRFAFPLLIISFFFAVTSCKKNKPTYKLEGSYSGNFQGIYEGEDTIINSGYLVQVEALDKSTARVKGTLFSPFDVLVTFNGLNIELVSPTDGLNQFLFEGDENRLTFTYENGGNIATYNGTK